LPNLKNPPIMTHCFFSSYLSICPGLRPSAPLCINWSLLDNIFGSQSSLTASTYYVMYLIMLKTRMMKLTHNLAIQKQKVQQELHQPLHQELHQHPRHRIKVPGYFPTWMLLAISNVPILAGATQWRRWPLIRKSNFVKVLARLNIGLPDPRLHLAVPIQVE
jgi:hypothetical protein